MKETSISTQEIVREGLLTSNPLRAHHQHEAPTLREYNNKNGKRNPEIVRETHITRKKASKLSKKKARLEKI